MSAVKVSATTATELRHYRPENNGQIEPPPPIMIEPAAGEKFDSLLDFRWLGNDLAIG